MLQNMHQTFFDKSFTTAANSQEIGFTRLSVPIFWAHCPICVALCRYRMRHSKSTNFNILTYFRGYQSVGIVASWLPKLQQGVLIEKWTSVGKMGKIFVLQESFFSSVHRFLIHNAIRRHWKLRKVDHERHECKFKLDMTCRNTKSAKYCRICSGHDTKVISHVEDKQEEKVMQ